MGRKAEDLTGHTFGYLKVLARSARKDVSRHVYWTCQCECCGKIKDIRGDNLQSGRVITCGCYKTWKSAM